MSVPMLIAAVVLCIAFSAFFSASEMALSSCNKVRLEHAAEEGNKRAARALNLTEHFDDALSAILVGNNLVNIAASSMGSVAVTLALGDQYAWVSTLVITVAVIIFGETVPKITAQKNATSFSQIIAGPIRGLSVILFPITRLVVALVNLLTMWMKGDKTNDSDAAVEELHTIIDTAEDEDVIDEDASELITAAIDFADISVSEIMTARVDVVAIDIDTWEEEIPSVVDSPFSRIPVYDGSIDHIIGVLSMNHFLKALIDHDTPAFKELLLEPCYVYKTMKLPAVLSALREAQQHLAIVTDEYGGTLGIVSMEDVLEQLVGEIWDETDDVEEEIVEQEDGTWELDGDTAISDVLELVGWKPADFDYDSETIGGWCIEMFDGFPPAGAAFAYDGCLVKVMDIEERRVRKVLIKKMKE